jgi:hypothetical protein
MAHHGFPKSDPITVFVLPVRLAANGTSFNPECLLCARQINRPPAVVGSNADGLTGFTAINLKAHSDASVQSVGRVARLSGNVGQPDHVLGNEIAGYKAERRPGTGEERLAATEYDGMEVKSILINKPKVG